MMSKIIQFYSRLVIKLFGIQFTVNNRSGLKNIKSGSLIICNHLSYLDVLMVEATHASSFVTSIEVKNTPFLGQLCEAGGCLYVERRSRKNLSHEIEDITNALKAGVSVVVFPEATSTNGDEVKRFKRPLFNSAINSGASIIPMAINYKSIDGNKVDITNRDTVFWYGDMSFFPHLWKVLKQNLICVEITVEKPIMVREKDEVSEVASLAHQIVSSLYQPIKKENSSLPLC